MREIKFRYFWQHGDTGRMTSRELSLGDITCGSVDHQTEQIGWGIPIITGLQYTGLKDRNGKEIYEWDIVQKSHGRYKIGVVVFRQGAFCFESRDNGVYAGDERFTQLHTMHYTECNFKVEYKVIGNIYEHSYLLDNNS